MTTEEENKSNWGMCLDCHGQGKRHRRLKKKARLRFKEILDEFEKTGNKETAPVRPKGSTYPCPYCEGTGLVPAEKPPTPDAEHLPHVAIIGGGIGGIALAIACLHRGIPFTLYERDKSFDERSQGYGLTLQQASRAMKELGITNLVEGVISTRHVVHTTEGEVIGEWGMRKWLRDNPAPNSKRTNIHIARQALRLTLLEQLGGGQMVQWSHQLMNFHEQKNGRVHLDFLVDAERKTTEADLLVGADGIRSTVRNILIGEDKTPLRYLGCIVILGICPLTNLKEYESELLDSATVFQTANGTERIYMMPFGADSVMWQLSYPMPEKEAKELSKLGVKALKAEACRITQWHSPIPEIMAATDEALISGYPVYDRELLHPTMLEKGESITLIGDAAHPMSPFKGQGANQALLDALSLARAITEGCKRPNDWRILGLRKNVLTGFEREMIDRTTAKVIASAKAVEHLHSNTVLRKTNSPRGKRI